MAVPVIARALAAQVVAVAVVWLLVQVARAYGLTPSGKVVVAAIGVAAAAIGYGWKLPAWWLPIQGSFFPGLVYGSGLGLPPHWFLVAMLLLLLVFPSNALERVPLYLSSRDTWNALLHLLPPEAPAAFVDLGCGSGGGLAHLARQRPRMHFVGVETAPLPFLLAWWQTRHLANCEVRLGSLWSEDLSRYEVVYAFLSPSPMPRLWDKVSQEMRPGTVFVSNSFEVPDHHPDRIVEVADARASRLLIWKL